MESSSPIRYLFTLRRSKVLRCLLSLLSITLVVSFIFLWNDLTSCAKRQGAGVLLALVWWSFSVSKESLFLLEICPFSTIFSYIEAINADEIHTVLEFSVSEISHVPVKMISHVYSFFYGYYSGGLLAFILLSIALFIYTGYERICLAPKDNLTNRIINKEFDALENFEFSNLKLNLLPYETVCSICITDFKEKDSIIRLPVCCHCFHAECLQKWLLEHCICPYCRSNIKENQKKVRNNL